MQAQTFHPTNDFLFSDEFQREWGNRSRAIRARLGKGLSFTVVGVEDIEQEGLVHALGLIQSGREYDSVTHFFNALHKITTDKMMNQISAGGISASGIHSADLRTGKGDTSRISRANIAETVQRAPLSLSETGSSDGDGFRLEEMLGEKAIFFDDELSERFFFENCPNLVRILQREGIAPQERREMLPKVGMELLEFVRTQESPENWYEELLDEGVGEILRLAYQKYEALIVSYEEARQQQVARGILMDNLLMDYRKSLVDFLAALYLVTMTSRGKRGPYAKKEEKEDVSESEEMSGEELEFFAQALQSNGGFE